MNNLAKSLLGRVEIHGRGTVTDNPRSLKIKAELAAKEKLNGVDRCKD